MLLIQFLVIIFVAFVMGKTLLDFQDHKITLKRTILWLFVWTILLIIAIMPEVMAIPAAVLGIKRSTDVFVYLGLMVLFYVVFLTTSVIDKNHRQIRKLQRKVAIMQAETEALIIEKTSKKIKKTKTRKKTTKKKAVKRKTTKKKRK